MRTYLACPYRFYLKHILYLQDQQPADLEWDAASYGTLIHAVLQDWADSEWVSCDAPNELAEGLKTLLQQRVTTLVGPTPSLPIRLQIREAEHRLVHFAHQQAAHFQAGWRILSREEKLSFPVSTAHGEITLVGTIDRIDEHPEWGKRLIDYKTSDRGAKPWNKHIASPRNGTPHWIDLQLPAYQMMTGIEECGYWNLPADETNLGWQAFGPPKRGKKPVPWPENLEDGLSALQRILDAISGKIFWPPAAPPRYEDGFGPLLADQHPDRHEWWQETHAP